MTDRRERHIAILGSTGSIGRSTLEVIRRYTDRYRVSYLTTNTNIDLLRTQIAEFRPRGVVVTDHAKASALKKELGTRVEILSGSAALEEVVCRPEVDLVVSSLVGFAGLKPTIAAIRTGKNIALANKETLVVAGTIIMSLVKEHGVSLIPIDSEHSAILQCLQGENSRQIERLILTASGGPFLHRPLEEFSTITVEEALRHPRWRMGNKITIDSATLMNKGLEVIEAHWLFDLPPERIEVVIHPQSIIHSMVEFHDGSIKAQLGLPDMKVPIQYALTYPDRWPMDGPRVDFPRLQSMTFFPPDTSRFPNLRLAYEALRAGGTAPAVLNAANEVAVDAFLHRSISFSRIPELVEDALAFHTVVDSPKLDDIIEADRSTRSRLRSLPALSHCPSPSE